MWGSKDDARAIHQANDRLHAGILTKGDFPNPDARFLKIFTFDRDTKTLGAERVGIARNGRDVREFDGSRRTILK